jgi:hypothetical protein
MRQPEDDDSLVMKSPQKPQCLNVGAIVCYDQLPVGIGLR